MSPIVPRFAVSGVYTYCPRQGTDARRPAGSRPAQLIERLGARNQSPPDVRHLLHTVRSSTADDPDRGAVRHRTGEPHSDTDTDIGPRRTAAPLCRLNA